MNRGIIGVIIILAGFGFSCGDSDTIVQSLMDLSGAPLGYDMSGATRHLAVAAVTMKCSHEKEANILRVLSMMRKIKAQTPEIRLVVFGETILGWYYDSDNPVTYQQQVAEPIPGPASERIAALADSLDIYCVWGMAEEKAGQVFNSQVLVNPDGEIQAVHRKVHFVNYDEDAGFAKGDAATITEIDGIRTGMIICADIQSYQLTDAMVGAEVRLIIHSLASDAVEFRIDTVARQFDAWAVFANRCGDENDMHYSGNCYIADPAGTIRVGGDGGERYESYTIGVYQ